MINKNGNAHPVEFLMFCNYFSRNTLISKRRMKRVRITEMNEIMILWLSRYTIEKLLHGVFL